MSVTLPVSHVEMWPYVASAAVTFESHAATAVRMLVSSRGTVGAGEGVQAPATCVTPHDVDLHGVPENALPRSTPSSTHQPRSWLKDVASLNIAYILMTLSILQSLRSWSKAEAPLNM